MTTLIIDADTILYQALMNAEQEVEFDDDVWMMTCDHKAARATFVDRINVLTEQAGTSDVAMCFSDSLNFRKEVYPLYKMNRKKVRKPMGFKEFRQEMMEEYHGITKPTLEADDVVGILATLRSDCIIYSEDKDLMQIPGRHLVDGQIIEVSKAEGDRFHMIQTLMGDAVDGYPGCPGIGKVKAEKIIAACSDSSEWWGAVLDTYASASMTSVEALTMARVAKILQVENWDKQKQEVILWEPSIAFDTMVTA